MRELFREVKLNSYFSAIAGLLIGLILLFWPGASLTLVCAVIGVAVLAVAVVQIVLFFRERMAGFAASYHLLLGILLLGVGGWFLISPESIGAIVPIIAGVYVVLHGITEVGRAISLQQEHYSKWWVALILALISIVLGLVLIFNAVKAGTVLIQLIGGLIIYDSVSNIWIISRVSKSVKQTVKDLEDERNGNIID